VGDHKWLCELALRYCDRFHKIKLWLSPPITWSEKMNRFRTSPGSNSSSLEEKGSRTDDIHHICRHVKGAGFPFDFDVL
jgi:hypothetical protein